MTKRTRVYASLFNLFLFASILPACSQKSIPDTAKTYTVSGSITQTHAYCGGIRPPAAQLTDLRTPKPFLGKKLFLKNGAVNVSGMTVVSEITADSLGHFKLQLPPGTYCIVEKDQVNSLDIDKFKNQQTLYLKLDEACLKQWWSKCQLTFEVTNADRPDLQINFYFPCDTHGIPCMTYTGPLRQ